MKMVWSFVYESLDPKMSDSHVGGRKKKSIRNHLFVIYGIINDVLHGKREPIDDDDVIAVSRCGVDSVAMNAYLNQKTNIKK